MLKSFFTFGTLTFFARIFGFLRDVVIAKYFGASNFTDAFFVAFRIPNLLRRLFAEGAFTQAFIPVLTESNEKMNRTQFKELINEVATKLFLILIIVTFFGIVTAPLIVHLFAPGFSADKEKLDLTIIMLKIMMPYILFISLTAFSGGILNIFGNFHIPAVTPVVLNISIIFFSIYISSFYKIPVLSLSVAVLLGGILQLLIQIPYLIKYGVIPRFSFSKNSLMVKKILKLMLPAVIGVSAAQISLLINTIFASFLVAGSVSWLYYADRLMELPIGVIGVALSTVLLPILSKSYVNKDQSQYQNTVKLGLKTVFLFGPPCAIGLFFLSYPIIITLFQRGEFTDYDSLMTSQALKIYSTSVLAFLFIKVLAPSFFAMQNMKTPVKIAFVSIFVVQFMNMLLVSRYQHLGLAGSITIGAWANASLLFFYFMKIVKLKFEKEFLIFVFRTLVSSLVLIFVIFSLKQSNDIWLEYSLIQRTSKLLIIFFIASVSYFISLYILGMRLSHYK